MASSPRSPDRRRWFAATGPAFLGLLAYLPALLTAPGVVAADTKQYLYLNPGAFLERARSLWDTSQFGGYVTHQQVGYLWPMGPWFWSARAIGLPVWVAQRLWVGSLIFAAALGARTLARRLGLDPGAALVVAVAYGFSPYLLSYVSRTSVLLLPWAALGWVLALTMHAVERGGWRAPAAVGLVVATVGGVNATALVLVGVGPLLWIVDAVWARRVTLRAAAAATGRLALCSTATSVWWVVGLVIEGRFGADVLRYSETIGAVSATSSATEVVRGLGYWLFYGSLVDGRWNSASTPYLTNPALLLLGSTLAALGLLGLVRTQWQARRWLVLQLLAGVVVAVAAHPPGGSSAYGRLLSGRFARSTLVLALRSSTRAVPLVVLSLSLGLGAMVAAASVWRPRWSRTLRFTAIGACLVNLPAIASRGYVDQLLRREAIPAWWSDAATALDGRGNGAVLELPGQDFAAYRWGTTTDPILPGLTERPLLTRDLLPLGGDQRMNLLYALDQRFQDGTIEPASIAPVARLLGATDVVARLDANGERYRTPTPARTWATLVGAPGLGAPDTYGPAPTADVAHPVMDPSGESGGAAPAPASVATFAVAGASGGARVAPAVGTTVVVGDGDGVVDAAAAGLLDGSAPVVYSADLGRAAARAAAVAEAGAIVVTDTNRASAHQWRGTQDVVGYTEDGRPTGFSRDEADARLAPFGVDAPDATRTLAVQTGGARVVASAYGEPNAYRPEDRAWFAMDGDPATAWLVGDRGQPVGAQLRVDLASARPLGALHLVQRQTPANRSIAAITVRTDHQQQRVVLDDASRTPAGQTIALDGSPTSSLLVTINATDVPHPASFYGLDAVGFAELGLTDAGASDPLIIAEVVHPPTDLDVALASVPTTLPVDYVLTRQRVDATNRWRHDPEPGLVRDVMVARAGTVGVRVQVRLDRRAADTVLAGLLGLDAAPTASSSLTGVVGARPWAAVDRDPATAWTSAMGDAVGAWWQRPLAPGTAVGAVDLRLVDDGHHSLPTVLRVDVGGATTDLPVPAPDASGITHLTLPKASAGDHLRLTVLDAEVRTTIDRRYGESVDLPVGLADVQVPGADDGRVSLPAGLDTGCRTDLLRIDGVGQALRVRGTWADAVAGRLLAVDPCPVPGGATSTMTLALGHHEVRSAPGGATGFDVDRVVVSLAGQVAAAGIPTGGARSASVDPHHGPTAYDVHLGAGTADGWLVLADAANPGWQATLAGRSLGPVRQLDGGAAAWRVPAGTAGVVHVRWRPQRWADLAQLASLAAVAACAVVLVVGRRRRGDIVRACADAVVAPPVLFVDRPWSASPWGSTVAVAGVTGVVAALVIHPLYGLVAAAVTAGAAGGGPVARRSVRLAGPLLVLVASGYVVARQVVSRAVAGFGWPLAMESAHRPVLLAVVLAAAAVLVDGRRSDERVDRRSDGRVDGRVDGRPRRPGLAPEHLEGGGGGERHEGDDG